jgi:hypothetical protein
VDIIPKTLLPLQVILTQAMKQVIFQLIFSMKICLSISLKVNLKKYLILCLVKQNPLEF